MKTETSFYTEVLNERIGQFVINEWTIDEVYMLADIADIFKIDIRLARYYLMRLVDKGVLCQIKWGRNTYYAHSCWRKPFRELGVKVL